MKQKAINTSKTSNVSKVSKVSNSLRRNKYKSIIHEVNSYIPEENHEILLLVGVVDCSLEEHYSKMMLQDDYYCDTVIKWILWNDAPFSKIELFLAINDPFEFDITRIDGYSSQFTWCWKKLVPLLKTKHGEYYLEDLSYL